jgi:hypothetical protein
MAIYRLIRALTGMEAGRWCRSCGNVIPPKDPFGMSEGVCPPCRRS